MSATDSSNREKLRIGMRWRWWGSIICLLGICQPAKAEPKIFFGRAYRGRKIVLISKTQQFGDQKAEYITQRSEEHTSELQSRPHLVCRLLLEKKKKKKQK